MNCQISQKDTGKNDARAHAAVPEPHRIGASCDLFSRPEQQRSHAIVKVSAPDQ
jgi:hypothetical protein